MVSTLWVGHVPNIEREFFERIVKDRLHGYYIYLPGNLRVTVLRRFLKDNTEYLVISFWENEVFEYFTPSNLGIDKDYIVEPGVEVLNPLTEYSLLYDIGMGASLLYDSNVKKMKSLLGDRVAVRLLFPSLLLLAAIYRQTEELGLANLALNYSKFLF